YLNHDCHHSQANDEFENTADTDVAVLVGDADVLNVRNVRRLGHMLFAVAAMTRHGKTLCSLLFALCPLPFAPGEFNVDNFLPRPRPVFSPLPAPTRAANRLAAPAVAAAIARKTSPAKCRRYRVAPTRPSNSNENARDETPARSSRKDPPDASRGETRPAW